MHNAHIVDEILGSSFPMEPEGAGLLAYLHQLIGKGLPARVIGKLERMLSLSPLQSARLLAISETSASASCKHRASGWVRLPQIGSYAS